MRLLLENFRTFRGPHTIPVAPLTILVGENSSGKTALMGALSIVSDSTGYPLRPNFNKPPYDFGNYREIASSIGKRVAHDFSLGFATDPQVARQMSVRATYRNSRGYVRFHSFEGSAHDFQISLSLSKYTTSSLSGSYSLRVRNHTFSKIPFETRIPPGAPFPFGFLVYQSLQKRATSKILNRALAALTMLMRLGECESLAPIRMKPERAFSQINEVFQPSGEHTPFLLEQLFGGRSISKQRQSVVKTLKAFGHESGLFDSIYIRRLSRDIVTPFQIEVELDGRRSNLVDVGYGVSQVLPIIVQTVMASPHEHILVQEPEIHLHPKAQAALASFFCRLASSARAHFMIETHSDYIVDRIRQEVAKKTISPESVALLYLERHGPETFCHRLELDGLGNIKRTPPGYRQFFLQEEMNLLRSFR